MRSFPQSVSNSARTGLRWAGITLAVALLAGEAGAQAPAPMAARQAAALTGAKVGTSQADTHEYRLANGLRLIVKEDHRAPTVAHMVW